MLNHFRTLLLNAPGPAPSAGPRHVDDGPGDEAVPPGFAPVRLPAHLAVVRAALFGADPDTPLLNYRAWQLMTLLHASELSCFVTALDPRVSYDVGPSAPAPFAGPAAFAPAFAGPPGLLFSGDPAAPDDTGRSGYAVQLSLAGATLTATLLHAGGTDRDHPVTFSGGLSSPVPLGDTGYSVRVPGPGDASWVAAGLLRPRLGPADLAVRLGGVGAALSEAFGPAVAEPYRTFKNLWETHPELPYRLGGAACALVYRTEEARLANAVP